MYRSEACRKKRNPGAPGFTLIELLVVIAVIALLVSILLPSIQRAKQLAETLKCTTNLRALAHAMVLYSGDYDGYVPRDWWYPSPNGNNNRLMWAELLSHYIEGGTLYDNIAAGDDDEYVEFLMEKFRDRDSLHCPGFERTEYPLHYAINGLDLEQDLEPGEFPGWVPFSRPAKLVVPEADVIYLTEANGDPADWNPDQFGQYDLLRKHEFVFNDGGVANPRPRMIQAEDRRHFGRTTVVCFDGHAEPRELDPDELPLQAFVPNYTSE